MRRDRWIIIGLLSIVIAVGAVVFFRTKAGKTEQVNPTEVFSVTRMNQWKTCIQYTEFQDAVRYEVYRSGEENGEYIKIGESTESVFYDTNAEGVGDAYYKVRVLTDYGESPCSEAEFTGYHAQEVCTVPVMMYHDCVTDGDLKEGILFDEYAVWYEEFEEDLMYLRDHGYTTITAEQLIAFMEGKGELPEKSVLLTIDDGKLGVYRNMYPLLQKYNMTASLAVIGEEIENTTKNLQARETSQAPYCTWTEIGEMSASGHVEIISHTYYLHAYNRSNRTGADVAEGETEEEFLAAATADCTQMKKQLLKITGKNNVTLCYPYSVRSEASDQGWLKCGYKLLLAGNDEAVSRTMANYVVYDAGCTPQSAVLRRIPRMTGTSLEQYLSEVETDDNK